LLLRTSFTSFILQSKACGLSPQGLRAPGPPRLESRGAAALKANFNAVACSGTRVMT
jgi:hypothetical protein